MMHATPTVEELRAEMLRLVDAQRERCLEGDCIKEDFEQFVLGMRCLVRFSFIVAVDSSTLSESQLKPFRDLVATLLVALGGTEP